MYAPHAPVFERVRLEEYRYPLPEERIARYPLAERDTSKLLHYAAGTIHHRQFSDLPGLLPQQGLLVFNNTRVIPARLHFRKDTGALIELFLLHPLSPSPDLQLAMGARGSCSWECMVGNRKRWKKATLRRELAVGPHAVVLEASPSEEDANTVHFRWSPAEVSFAELIEAAGEIPLPPYLNRKAEQEDKDRYQTVYSSQKGAVAAPTAGLHFSPAVLEQLRQRGIATEELTLHVGAGTFQPIKDENLALHPMHREQIIVTAATIARLLQHPGPVVAVGTTSMRSLESLYWYGVLLLLENPDASFFIPKDTPYRYAEAELPSLQESLGAVLEKLQGQARQEVRGETEIFIVPGYRFRVCQGLVTNFHQPESTLMLLVAAFVGPDWKKIYQEALNTGYRFLSYGDSSLLLPASNP
jgi:S-adenosylmethionine:tRNA ribosyltransferase-isomerase